jgi:4-amino-4-deoxy-L-arabinose transferase-like glycosyltransferase
VIFTVLAALAFVAALFASRRAPARVSAAMDRVEPRLRRFGPVIVAVGSAVITWWVWGQLQPMPIVHDESSYVLQSEIFARGRWTVPSPPIPAFFEQPHVQVVPAVASKYPPGHALILTFGALVGFPALMPLLLSGITGALLFALTARLSNVWVALLASAFWITAPIVLQFQPGYFSEVTTAPLILSSWWALLAWRDTRRRRWLLLLALAVGWGAITRPLTMLAIAVPIGVVVIHDVIRRRTWRDFGLAVLVGCAVLVILPLWNARTTGNWRLSAIELYRRDYQPFDKMGFTADTTPPLRRASMSPVLMNVYDNFLAIFKEQRVETLPQTMSLRTLKLAIGFFQGPRLLLLPFAVAGLFAGAAFQFAALSALAVFIAYLPYAHYAGWTVYYLELAPVVAALTAVGVWRATQRIASADRARFGVLCVTVVLVAVALRDVARWRREHLMMVRFYRDFANSAKNLPSQPTILFVKYSDRVRSHFSVVHNFADLEHAPVWVVHDLGERNAELERLAPNRSTHTFDEAWFRSR